jgi:3-hydroxybutyryl-CoA dehydratase
MRYAKNYSFQEIKENSEFSRLYTIDECAYGALLSTFRDKSPIHVDERYAQSAGFSGRICHGAILQGFLSHFVGMYFPGKRSLILSVNISYRRPSYLGDEVRLIVTVRQKVEIGQVVVLDVRFVNTASNDLVASGRVQVSMRNE